MKTKLARALGTNSIKMTVSLCERNRVRVRFVWSIAGVGKSLDSFTVVFHRGSKTSDERIKPSNG